jgi:phosphoadenosine phosphosulfate reductase
MTLSAISEGDLLYARLSQFKRLVDIARQRITRALVTASAWSVSFSGGKDSTVVLDLVRRIDPATPAIFVDSGVEFPETLAFIDQTPNVICVESDIPLLEMYRMVGEWGYKGGDSSLHWPKGATGNSNVRHPLDRVRQERDLDGAFTGLRADESVARSWFSKVNRQPWQMKNGSWRCEPIIDWPQEAVWAYIAGQKLPYNAVYDKYAELGLPRKQWRVSNYAGVTGNEFGRWLVLKRGWPELWRKLVEEFPQMRSYS